MKILICEFKMSKYRIKFETMILKFQNMSYNLKMESKGSQYEIKS